MFTISQVPERIEKSKISSLSCKTQVCDMRYMIETSRLKLYAASQEQMEAFIAAQSADVLKAACTDAFGVIFL